MSPPSVPAAVAARAKQTRTRPYEPLEDETEADQRAREVLSAPDELVVAHDADRIRGAHRLTR